MTLSGFLTTVYLPSRIEVSADYAALLRSLVAGFSAHLGRTARLIDLTEPTVCGYLAAYRATRSAVSTNNQRRMLLTLWRAAWDRMLLERSPRPGLIRRLPEDWAPPEAWTVDEVAALLTEAAKMRGDVAGVPAGLWWSSLIATVYWTGCRIGALRWAASVNYRGGMLLIRGQKNGRAQLYVLPESCCAAIDATRPHDRPLLWPWPWHYNRLFVVMRAIAQRSGAACPPGGRQLFHRIRRTNLSLCAAVDPAIAQRQAGHRDYGTTLRHYIDPRLAGGLTAADVLPEPTARPRLHLYG